MLLSQLWGDFLQLAFPNTCGGCQSALLADEEMVCTTCRLNFPLTHFHQMPADNPMFDKFKGRLPIVHASAFLHFVDEGVAQSLAHEVKYNGFRDLGIQLGRWYGYQLAATDIGSRFDCLVPVPLHSERQKRRGYNQAACFAKGISEAVGIPLREDLVFRSKATLSQVRMEREQRVANTADAFHLFPNTQPKNLRILIVDDVVTTGATIEACATPLVRGGCETIGVLALANV
jgi:ComF family protein